jgi:hypothetical protein
MRVVMHVKEQSEVLSDIYLATAMLLQFLHEQTMFDHIR